MIHSSCIPALDARPFSKQQTAGVHLTRRGHCLLCRPMDSETSAQTSELLNGSLICFRPRLKRIFAISGLDTLNMLQCVPNYVPACTVLWFLNNCGEQWLGGRRAFSSSNQGTYNHKVGHSVKWTSAVQLGCPISFDHAMSAITHSAFTETDASRPSSIHSLIYPPSTHH